MKKNRKFFDMPFQAAGQSRDYEKLGYWSRPFYMTPEDVPVITYTVPLFDRAGQVHGVIGGGDIPGAYKSCCLPTSSSAQDSPGYMVAAMQENPQELFVLVKKGEYQNRLFGDEPLLRIKQEDETYSICQVSSLTGEKIYGCIKSLDL
ncbi:MAG: PDC sensor domain-containing protein [Acutalibacteraceae bacterium]